MSLIPALTRKRRPSSPVVPPTASSRSSKFPKLFDGPASQSLESTSTGKSKSSIKVKVQKKVSSIKIKLGLGDKSSEESVNRRPRDVFPLVEGSRSTYTLLNDSNNTTVHRPMRLRLHAIADIEEEGDMPPSAFTRSAPVTPPVHQRHGADDYMHLGSLHEGLRSQSTPGLQRRLSQTFRQPFSNGLTTVIKRTGKRSRPSVQTLAMESATATSSSPSTYNSGSLWGTRTNISTPLTSEPTTPRSLLRYGSLESFDQDRLSSMNDSRVLAPIPESTTLPTVTIRTVEAAAAAKVHVELRYSTLLSGTSARDGRGRHLESTLRAIHLPPDSQLRARKAWEKAESDNLRQCRVLMNTANKTKASQGLSAGGFEVVAVLGKGSFGVVRLVRTLPSQDEITTAEKLPFVRPSKSTFFPPHKPLSTTFLHRRKSSSPNTSKVYAMKVIRKSDMIRNGQEGHLRAERDFLVAAEGSRWVIPLIASFQDQKHLYLVMEYCIGGDFLGLLIRKNILSEEVTKWYIAQMILCVEEAHRMRWIHRDVKPDNFLIAYNGHLKISDFGLAFDGSWAHDQKFYQSSRHSLMEELGIEVAGDEQDRTEKQSQSDKRHAKSDSIPADQPVAGEPILDFRHRTQRRRMARSVVGTSQYMAPEVIGGDMYDGRCD